MTDPQNEQREDDTIEAQGKQAFHDSVARSAEVESPELPAAEPGPPGGPIADSILAAAKPPATPAEGPGPEDTGPQPAAGDDRPGPTTEEEHAVAPVQKVPAGEDEVAAEGKQAFHESVEAVAEAPPRRGREPGGPGRRHRVVGRRPAPDSRRGTRRVQAAGCARR